MSNEHMDIEKILAELDDIQWTKEDESSAGNGENGDNTKAKAPKEEESSGREVFTARRPVPSSMETSSYPQKGKHEAPGYQDEEETPVGDAGDDLTADIPIRMSNSTSSPQRSIYDREKEEEPEELGEVDEPAEAEEPEEQAEEEEGELEIKKQTQEKQEIHQEIPQAPPRPKVVVAEPTPPPPPRVYVQPSNPYEQEQQKAPSSGKQGGGTGLKWILAFLLSGAVLLGGYLIFREFLAGGSQGNEPSPSPGGDYLTITIPPMNTYTAPPTAPPTSYYSITVTAGSGGSVSPSGSVDVEEGHSVTFTILPDAGYEISQLLIDGSSVTVQSSYTFDNVSRNHTLYAVFQPLESPPPTEIPATEVPTAEPTTEAEVTMEPATPEAAPPAEDEMGFPAPGEG